MNIYAYHKSGYTGELVKIELSPSFRTLTVLGLPSAQQRAFKQKATALFALLGKAAPTALIQIPLTKDWESLELAILLAILLAKDQLLHTHCPDILILGKVALDGSISPIPTLFDAPALAKAKGCKIVITAPTPRAYPNTETLEIVACPDIATALHQCRRFIIYHEGDGNIPVSPSLTPQPDMHPFSHIIGLEKAKKALALSAAGGLNILLYGPPGGGKTLLLSTLIHLIPPLSEVEEEEIARIRGEIPPSRPLVEILPHMGEKDLHKGDESFFHRAHRGVLLVDELTNQKERTRKAISFFLEKQSVNSYPIRFTLASAMNGCPCGNMGREEQLCICSEKQRVRHWSRVGSPLLDRFDIVLALLPENLLTTPLSQEDPNLLNTIKRVWVTHQKRDEKGYLKLLPLLNTSLQGRGLSMRASISVCKIASLIAEFKKSEVVREEDMVEALSFKTYGVDRHWR